MNELSDAITALGGGVDDLRSRLKPVLTNMESVNEVASEPPSSCPVVDCLNKLRYRVDEIKAVIADIHINLCV